jgi:NADH-quinone oxidoreductase subunit J
MAMIMFYAFGAIAVIASLLVIGQRNPMYSVLLLIVSFGALAGLYVLLDAPFVAVTQIIIYAGAIMVLFLFVVMLLNVPREEPAPAGLIAAGRARTIGGLLAVVLAVELIWALSRVRSEPWHEAGAAAPALTSVREIGIALFTKHAFAFEVTSILILVAMVGAVVLARREDSGREGRSPGLE